MIQNVSWTHLRYTKWLHKFLSCPSPIPHVGVILLWVVLCRFPHWAIATNHRRTLFIIKLAQHTKEKWFQLGTRGARKTCAAGLNMHCLMIQCPLSLGLVHEQRTSSSYCMKNIIRYIFNASINLSGVPDQQSRCHASVVCRSVHCALQCCPCPCALSRILPKWHSAARNNALDCFWQWEHTDTHQK